MRRRLAIAASALVAVAAGCEDRSYREIGGQINLITQRSDHLVPPAIRRLASFGGRALPQIEIALHTASPAGKTNLVRAIEAIADPEGAAILRHFAVYDPAPEVRAACEETLARWSDSPDARADAARAALARIAEKRARGEGPVVVGDRAPAGP
jgi:hypothetical protein